MLATNLTVVVDGVRLMRAAPTGWRSPRSKYFLALYNGTPNWLTAEQVKQYREIMKRAARLRRSGRDVHVDHIVPLVSDYVCGLNVPWNLQIIDAKANMSKGNRHWPDSPWENHDLFGEKQPMQLRLPI